MSLEGEKMTQKLNLDQAKERSVELMRRGYH